MRDIENKVLDLKSEMERRVLQIIEENPKRILQHVRMIEEKEANLWAENLNRHSKNSESLQLMNAKNSDTMGQLGNVIMSLRNEMEDLKYKNVELTRNIQSLAVKSNFSNFQGVEQSCVRI